MLELLTPASKVRFLTRNSVTRRGLAPGAWHADPRFAPKPENPAVSRNFKNFGSENYGFYFCFSQRPLNRNHFPTAFFARTRRALSNERGFASPRVHLAGAQAS